MTPLRFLTSVAFSLALQSAQATIPDNERSALIAILQHASPQALESWSSSDENICNIEKITCDEPQAHITGLDLSRLELTELSPDINQLANLEELDLSVNELSTLPSELSQLSTLTKLMLSANNLTSIPPSINQLTLLTKLSLAFNPITQLPPEIGQLTSLSWLSLSKNQLTELPPEIGLLTNLEHLNLNNVPLTNLPIEIGQLSQLKFLYLSGEQWQHLPTEIFLLTHLNSFTIRNTQIRRLPPGLGHLTELTHLSLNDNQLASLPAEIGQLSSLVNLRLDHNNLTSIPTEIGQLTALEYLGLSFNQLTELPDELAQLTALTEFTASFNQLNTLPEFGHLTELHYLILSDNQLSTLPSTIGHLINLDYLHLSANKLTSLPPEIGHLTQLSFLELQDNKLTVLPAEIGQLTALVTLDLASNQLISLPTEIGQLTNVQRLYLTDNLLTSLPDTLMGITGGLICEPDCITALDLPVLDNCLSETDLSENMVNWLNSAAVWPPSAWHEAQNDICSKPESLLAYTTSRSLYRDQFDFINTESDTQTAAAGSLIAYTIYTSGASNRSAEVLSTGQASRALIRPGNEHAWRIDTQDLAEGTYDIIFWTENNLYPTGIQAWKHTFIKAYAETSLPDNLDLTGSFALNNAVGYPELSPALNLWYSLFPSPPPLIGQLTEVLRRGMMHHNTESYWTDDNANQNHFRPFAIKKGTETPGIHHNSDGLIEFNTHHLRTITAAPAIGNIASFKTTLASVGLNLEKISPTGVIQTKLSHTRHNQFYYSAKADLISKPIPVGYREPGLYFETAHQLPSAPMAYFVYYNEQEQLMQQAVPSTPFDWPGLKSELQTLGFSHISIALNGVISAEKNNQSYQAYMAYDVHKTSLAYRWTTLGLSPIGDVNNDGHEDWEIVLADPDAESRVAWKQTLYLFPIE